MLDFQYSSQEDFTDFGRSIWRACQSFTTHEQASQFIVKSLYEEFLTEDGEPKLALVRIYRLTPVRELPRGVQAKVSQDERQVMALTGTYGIEAAWRDRRQSVGHQAVPLSAIALPQQIPMFQEVLRQLGVDMDYLYAEQEILGGTGSKGHFYVLQVPDNPVIPAQDNFVRPYHIESLIGFGGFMSSSGGGRSMYMLYAFSRQPIPFEAVEKTSGLPEFIGASLASRDSHRGVFDD
jgi:hypothetical protein